MGMVEQGGARPRIGAWQRDSTWKERSGTLMAGPGIELAEKAVNFFPDLFATVAIGYTVWWCRAAEYAWSVVARES